MRKERKRDTSEEEVAILKRHLLDKVPVSDLCEELGLQPTVLYRWQKEFFENGAAFQGQSRANHQAERQRIEFLEKKIQTKDEVGRVYGRAYRPNKKSWGALTKVWVLHDVRDLVVDLIRAAFYLITDLIALIFKGVMTERIVVMLAYHFPPENSIGGTRPYHFYKYLSEMGYRCHVITAADQGRHPNLDTEYVPDPFVTSPRLGIGWQVERAVRKLLFPGVAGFQWSRLACRAASAFLLSKENAEITIYSTFPPLGTHLAALLLARRKTLKWIADFRDPLSNDPDRVGFTKFQLRCHGWLEQVILRRADIVIVNTDALAGQWKSAYPNRRDRIHLIWNGFDPADRIEQTALPQRTHRLFSHVGALYAGRNISPLLESISRLIDTGRLVVGSLRIRLVGSINKDCIPGAEFLARAKNQGWLEIIPDQVPHHEARRMAQESDGLLLVQPHTAILVPGKLFEYLRLRRPILAFILPDTPIERILKRSGVTYRCVYADNSFQAIDNAVESFFNRKEEASEANTWFEENFDAKKQTQALDALIRSIHGR